MHASCGRGARRGSSSGRCPSGGRPGCRCRRCRSPRTSASCSGRGWRGRRCSGAGPSQRLKSSSAGGVGVRLDADAARGACSRGRGRRAACRACPTWRSRRRSAQSLPRAALRAVLDDAVVLAGGLDGDAALVDVVAARLLDVDVLAGLAGPDGHQRVPVVRRGDRDGVDVLVVERLADVLHGLGRCPPCVSSWSTRLAYVRVSGSIR